MIGQSIKRIIPQELQTEEDEILAKLRRGERIEHFDTVRMAKNGRRIAISLTISPIRDTAGNIVGASKVARDITERKRSEETQRLLFDELNHRVKNTLASIQAIASQSLRRAPNPNDFVSSFNGRLQALARAHDLLVQGELNGTTLTELIREQVALGSLDGSRISYSGPDVSLDARVAVQLALVLHELATNARKYGALSVPTGQLSIQWDVNIGARKEVFLKWQERGVPNIKAPRSYGFGSTLIKKTIEANRGEAVVHYGAEGLTCEITLPLQDERSESRTAVATKNARKTFWNDRGLKNRAVDLSGKRVLLIEDEPLVAMEMESELSSLGLEVIGPAAHVDSAKQLIADNVFEAALVDVNLNGTSVEEVAAALAQKGVPFAFATGYGRDALPEAFRDAPLLAKPVETGALIDVLSGLLSRRHGRDNVTPMRS
jgi:two-component sensor histidine kinase